MVSPFPSLSARNLRHSLRGPLLAPDCRRKIAGSADHRGWAANPVSSRPVRAALRFDTNHGGVGAMLASPCSSDRGDGRKGR